MDIIVENNKTVVYAGEELKKLLNCINIPAEVHILSKVQLTEHSIVLATKDSINFKSQLSDSLNPYFDDGYDIHIKGNTGYIIGTNPRSVLFAVYRYMKEQGFKYFHPGEGGTLVPDNNLRITDISIVDIPFQRYRGVCIEGATSLETVCQFVEWMPKVGLNSFFMQFEDGFTFFDRWYLQKQSTPITHKDTRNFTSLIEHKIKELGLVYHAVGHGWTCEPFGVSCQGWDYKETQLKETTSPYIAQIHGRREFYQGLPINTQLCYSNPMARNKVINYVLTFFKKHINIDILHFWLADEKNNHCECEECSRISPSDLYITFLNELDKALTEHKIDTKIVFLLYNETLWPPIKEQLINEDRFIMMFAPITRSYTKPFPSKVLQEKEIPYIRNAISPPKTPEKNLQFLRKWQKNFNGDSFIYEYHILWEYFKDTAEYDLAGTLYRDILNLKHMNLQGYISCQTLRAFFPTGLLMHTLAHTLWYDDRISFNKLVSDYLYAIYDKNSSVVLNFIKTVSSKLKPSYLRGELGKTNPEVVKSYRELQNLLKEFSQQFIQLTGNTSGRQKEQFKLLNSYCEITDRYLNLLIAKADGNMSECKQLWDNFSNYISGLDNKIEQLWDTQFFLITMHEYFHKQDYFGLE